MGFSTQTIIQSGFAVLAKIQNLRLNQRQSLFAIIIQVSVAKSSESISQFTQRIASRAESKSGGLFFDRSPITLTIQWLSILWLENERYFQ